MRPESEQLLHESELALQDTRAQFLKTNSVNASFCEMGFTGMERAIKAYEMERRGNITQGKFRGHNTNFPSTFSDTLLFRQS